MVLQAILFNLPTVYQQQWWWCWCVHVRARARLCVLCFMSSAVPVCAGLASCRLLMLVGCSQQCMHVTRAMCCGQMNQQCTPTGAHMQQQRQEQQC